jgi:chromosome partitioning protein
MGLNMPVIVIANQKGGTGKTSISLNLIHHIKPDLIIDADIHKGISNILSLGDNKIEVRRATDKNQIVEWVQTDKTVLIDCGGFDSDITRYAISQGDYIITPTTDDPTDQFALRDFNKVLASVSKMVNEKLTANVLLNRVHHSRHEFKDIDLLIDGLEHLDRLPVMIQQSAQIPKAAFKGEGVKGGSVSDKFKQLSKIIKEQLESTLN